MAHIWYTMKEGSHAAPRKDLEMPRRKMNPYPVGSAEFLEEEDRRAALPVETDRSITVRVSNDAIAAAKSLAVLSGMHYKAVLGNAAQQGVEALAGSVRKVLSNGHDEGEMPF